MSAAKTAANRRNAQRSTGPKTPEGKFRSSKNAEKHGIFSTAIIVNGESKEEWNAFRGGMVRYYNPCGPRETSLAEQIALLQWRERRVARYEAAAAAHTELLSTEPNPRPPQREMVERLYTTTPPKSGPADPFEAAERTEAIAILSQPPEDPNKPVHHRVAGLAMEACGKVLELKGDRLIPDPRHAQFLSYANVKPFRGNILAAEWTEGNLHTTLREQAIKALWPEQVMIPYVLEQLRFDEKAYDPALAAMKLRHEEALQAEKDLKALPNDKEADKVLRYEGMLSRKLKLLEDQLLQLIKNRKAGLFDDDDDDEAMPEEQTESPPMTPPPESSAEQSHAAPEAVEAPAADDAQVQPAKASPSPAAIAEHAIECALIRIQAADEADPARGIIWGPERSSLRRKTIEAMRDGSWVGD